MLFRSYLSVVGSAVVCANTGPETRVAQQHHPASKDLVPLRIAINRCPILKIPQHRWSFRWHDKTSLQIGKYIRSILPIGAVPSEDPTNQNKTVSFVYFYHSD